MTTALVFTQGWGTEESNEQRSINVENRDPRGFKGLDEWCVRVLKNQSSMIGDGSSGHLFKLGQFCLLSCK